jgi:ppGpp synthetase/RelA/SpoT-type nucleotidyltranferase
MDNHELSRQFEDKKRTFENLETEAVYIIRAALQQTDIKLHSTTSRVKKFQSFLDKVERHQTKNPFEEINDLVGVRVTCSFLIRHRPKTRRVEGPIRADIRTVRHRRSSYRGG